MALPPLLDRKRGLGLGTVAVLTLVQGGAAGAAAFATRGLFEAMHSGAPLPVAGLGVLIGAGLAIASTRVAARHVGERIGQAYARDIRAALFNHAARMPARAVGSRRAGYVALRFVGDMTAFRNWLGLGLPRLIAAVVLIPAMMAVLWWLDPVFVGVVAPVLGVTLAAVTAGGLRLIPLQRRLRARRARIAAEMAERMPLAPQLDRLGRRGTELGLLDRRTDAMVTAALRHRLWVEGVKALPDLAAGIAAALVILAGYRAGLGPGAIAAALAALGLLIAPLRDLGGVWNHRAAYCAAAVKAGAALSRGERDLYRARRSLPKGPARVAFDGVALPSGRTLTCTLEAGVTSTLHLAEMDADAVADMLLGLDAPVAGRILLSDIDLRDLSRGALRRGMQRVGTQPEILFGSLRRAMLMGCDDRPDDATLATLAREVGLGNTLDRLGGLDGTVLERGRNLSRGERIGLCLARLSLHPPRVVVLGAEVDATARARVEAQFAGRRVTVIRLAEPPEDTAAAA